MGKYNHIYVNKGLGRNIYGQDVAERNRIGYCYCQNHPGFLTKAILKEKRCVENNCRYLQKFEDHGYWVAKAKNKEAKQKSKQIKREIKNNENLILELLRDETYDIDDFCILSVEKVDKKYVVRCAYLYKENYYFVNKLRNIASSISELNGFYLQFIFIQNTYHNKKEIINKVLDEQY